MYDINPFTGAELNLVTSYVRLEI